MSDFRADLHCHSTCSDGSLTPLELLELAAQKEIQALSITDHDSIAAYTPEVLIKAAELGILLIPGVEFSTGIGRTSIHLLGYNFSLQSPQIAALCLEHVNRRKIRYVAILERLRHKGMPITVEELLETADALGDKQHTKIIGRPHIAQTMVKLGYVESIQEAFKKYIGENAPCYVQGEQFSVKMTIDVIHQAGGKAIIAHPHLIKNNEILTQLLAMDFDGIECYYSKFGMKEHQRWIKIAENRKWIITGGSDFHGDIKPSIPLGCSWINEDLFKAAFG